MTAQWQYQVRFDLNDAATAESARRNLRHPLLAPLADILANHRAALKCQFDAFAEYVATAEEHGVENYPLFKLVERGNPFEPAPRVCLGKISWIPL